jgi:hypothetical protein
MSTPAAVALLAFACTVAIEGVIAALVLRRGAWLETLAIQLTTWPVANFLIWKSAPFWPVESGVAIAETFLWLLVVPLTFRRAALLSFGANGVTALIGWQLARMV